MGDASIESNPISPLEKKSSFNSDQKRDIRGRWTVGESTKSNPTLWASIWRKLKENHEKSKSKTLLKKQERERDRSDDERLMSRRRFLALGGAGLMGFGLMAYGEGWVSAKEGKIENQAQTFSNPIRPEPDQPKKVESISPPEKVLTPTDLLNEILSFPLRSAERIQKETEYVNRIRQSTNLEPTAKLKLIDSGFWVLSDINQRAYLLDLRYQQRGESNSGLSKLSSEQLKWAKETRIHPEVLGLCLDTEKKARDIIARLISLDGGKIDKFRPDLVRLQEFNHPKAVSLGSVMISDMMINPGGMARLVCYETGLARGKEDAEGFLFNNFVYGFSFIGGKQAVTEINPEAFPTAIPALRELCELLKINTGLNFIPENIPGSEWRDKHINISGGAIGLQFMPSKALEIYYLLEKVNYKFNPFDLESALIGAWVFLARGELIGNNEVRFGYLKGHADKIKGAIAKWNPLADQINKIYNAAVDYYNKIIEPPLIQAAKH